MHKLVEDLSSLGALPMGIRIQRKEAFCYLLPEDLKAKYAGKVTALVWAVTISNAKDPEVVRSFYGDTLEQAVEQARKHNDRIGAK